MNERIPPQKLDAEVAVIGGLMLEPDAFDEVFSLVKEEDFFKPAYRKIYSAIRDLNKKGEPTDLITLSSHLSKNNILENMGGPNVLTEILNQTPSAANIQNHAKILRSKALLRNLIRVSEDIIDTAYNQKFDNLEDFFGSVESSVFSITEKKGTQELLPLSDLVKESMDRLDTLYKAKKGEVIGLPSGFIELDRLTSGFQPGEFTIIAARPSMGKTALSLNMALHAAINEKKKVAYFSLEMSKEQLMLRLLSSEGKLPLNNLRIGEISEEEWPKLIDTAVSLSDSKLFIDDSSGLSPLDIRSKARRMKAKHGLDLIIVDYLQLMTLNHRPDNREREVSEISRMLKSISKELNTPLVSLAQLNRGVESRSDRRPMLSDLRESGSIEQDADLILMIYREDYYDKENLSIRGLSEIIVAKQRNGPIGTIKLKWHPEYGLFVNDIESDLGPNPPLFEENHSKETSSDIGSLLLSPDVMNQVKNQAKQTKKDIKNYAPKEFEDS